VLIFKFFNHEITAQLK